MEVVSRRELVGGMRSGQYQFMGLGFYRGSMLG